MMAPSNYFRFFWSGNERVCDLAESLLLAKVEASNKHAEDKQIGRGIYTAHLQASAALSGIEDGHLVKVR